MHLSTTPSGVLFYGTILTCVWGSLRWVMPSGARLLASSRWWRKVRWLVSACAQKLPSAPCPLPSCCLDSRALRLRLGLPVTSPSSVRLLLTRLPPSRAAFWISCRLSLLVRSAPSCLGFCPVTLPLGVIHALCKSQEPSATPPSAKLYGSHPCRALCWLGDVNCTYPRLCNVSKATTVYQVPTCLLNPTVGMTLCQCWNSNA